MKRIILCFVLLFCANSAQGEILGQARLEVDDLIGNPITSAGAGSDFLLKGFVKDLRIPPAPFGGVFGAKFDIPYTSPVTATGPITIGSFFTLLAGGTLVPGQVHDIGGYAISITPPGPDEQFLFSVRFHANQAGQVTFQSLLSMTPGYDYLMYGINNAIPAEQINFISTSLTVVPEPPGIALFGIAVPGLVICWARIVRRKLSSTSGRTLVVA